MLYHAYEFNHAAISPWRQVAQMTAAAMRYPLNPFSEMLPARTTAAACDMFVNATRRYGKPEFGIVSTEIDGEMVDVVEEIVVEKPFCNLVRFRRLSSKVKGDAPVLVVAPMSGHFATLLRGTVAAMLPHHDVYITDWIDARNVPLAEGRFGLDDYIDYVDEFCAVLHAMRGERTAIMAVCQPGVPVLASASLMAEDEKPHRPSAIVLMGSPIDTTRNPTEPNVLATTRPLSWFEKNVILTVPWPNMGFMRRVYPGFLQLSGFMSMNLDRHVDAHAQHFQHLIQGDGDSVDAHRAFYDEYMAVMDMTAEFYLETIEVVFQTHALPRGKMKYRGVRPVRPSAITDIALMTIEGEKDDITGRGQTSAAHDLCTSLPDALKTHWEQDEVGHYGVFNGSRFRSSIQPRIAAFVASHRDAEVTEVEDTVAPLAAPSGRIVMPPIAADEEASTPLPNTVTHGESVVTAVADTVAMITNPSGPKKGGARLSSAGGARRAV